MERNEIVKCIDEGANYYLRLLGDAQHMEYSDNGLYSIIRPKAGQEGGTSLFQLKLEHLADKELQDKVKEIKAYNIHTWWGLGLSERMQEAIYGNNRPVQATEDNEEEGCMAMVFGEKPQYDKAPHPITVRKVSNLEEFRLWANITNRILNGGYALIHPENHYPLAKNKIMSCYIGYYEDSPAAVCSVIHNGGNFSLEFVCTEKEYRRKGLASAVCIAAIEEAFQEGAGIITLRAYPEAKKLYTTLGFRIY